MHFTRSAFAVASLALVLGFAGVANAEETKFTATLDGAHEVPPNDSSGTGMADISWNPDTMELSWTIEYSGLSGPATAAHFHGPAVEGENAGVAVPIDDVESPSEGSATLTKEQASELADGKWYVNVHTEAHPDGEIRGQVIKAGM